MEQGQTDEHPGEDLALSVDAIGRIVDTAGMSGQERARLAAAQLDLALQDPELLEASPARQVLAIEFALQGLEEAGLT